MGEAIGEARKLGIPRNLAVYASHAGLLADGGKVVDSLSGLIPSGMVRGRDLNMNQIQVLIEQNRQGRREAGLGSSFDEAAADANAASEFRGGFANEVHHELVNGREDLVLGGVSIRCGLIEGGAKTSLAAALTLLLDEYLNLIHIEISTTDRPRGDQT